MSPAALNPGNCWHCLHATTPPCCAHGGISSVARNRERKRAAYQPRPRRHDPRGITPAYLSARLARERSARARPDVLDQALDPPTAAPPPPRRHECPAWAVDSAVMAASDGTIVRVVCVHGRSEHRRVEGDRVSASTFTPASLTADVVESLSEPVHAVRRPAHPENECKFCLAASSPPCFLHGGLTPDARRKARKRARYLRDRNARRAASPPPKRRRGARPGRA